MVACSFLYNYKQSRKNPMSVNTSKKFRQKLAKPSHHNGNPEYEYWYPEWCKMRDVILGQKQLKSMTTQYLPKYAKMNDEEYSDYLGRTTFYNMASRTLDGMIGTAFLRDPKIKGLDKGLVPNLKHISKKGSSLLIFTKQVTEEMLKIGRVGVLVDMAANGGEPYFAAYLAENIVDWDISTDGREELIKVVLREIKRSPDEISAYHTTWRVLRMVNGVYEQHVYNVEGSTDLVNFDTRTPDFVIVPNKRGAPFDYIPFKFFGPRSNETEIEKPPLLDIADINLSHYTSTAQLEQGRWYTGLPIYWSEVGPSGEQQEYDIAPNVVWQLAPGGKAGILEFNGQGLIFLEKALEQKENQISALGGRMITNRPDSTGKSTEETNMNERNERSLLVNVSNTLDEGFTVLLQWWAAWQDQVNTDGIEIKFNKDFMLDKLAAREFRAITTMYQEGILPIEALHEVFQRINIIPDSMDLEDFKISLDNLDQFPNNPDIAAMQEGFPDAQSKFNHDEAILADARSIEAARVVASAAKAAAEKASKEAPVVKEPPVG